MRHEPSGLVGDAQHAVELVRGHAFLDDAEKVCRQQPLCERDFGALKHGSDRDRELALAFVAVVEAGTMRALLAFDLGDALGIGVAAMRAVGTIRPTDGLKSFAGCVFVGEHGVAGVRQTWLASLPSVDISRTQSLLSSI